MMKNLLIISLNKLKKFYTKYLEIKEELKELNFNQEGVFDSVVAPLFFVITNNFTTLNQSILYTGILLLLLFFISSFTKAKFKICILRINWNISSTSISKNSRKRIWVFYPWNR